MARSGFSEKQAKANIDQLKKVDDDLMRILKEIKDQTKAVTAKTLKERDDIRNQQDVLDVMTQTAATAKMISKDLGAEEGVARVMSTKLEELIFYNKDIQTALKQGDSDLTRENMVRDIFDTLVDSGQFDKRDLDMFDDMIGDFKETFNWDKIEEKGMSMWFPVTQAFYQTAENMRKTVEGIPVIGRAFSIEMVEHYRTGVDEIKSSIQSEMSAILAPIDALTGPFRAVIAIAGILWKMFSTGPTTYEQETAKYTQKTYEILAGQAKADKVEKGKQTGKRGAGFLDKMIRGAFGLFMTGASVVFAAIGTFGTFLTGTLLPAITGVIKAFGKVFFLITAVVSFAYGFLAGEGDFLSRLQNGLVTMLNVILEIPIRIMGWLFDKITGTEGNTEDMLARGKDLVGTLIGNLIGFVRDLLMSPFETLSLLWNFIVDQAQGLVQRIPGLGDTDLSGYKIDVFKRVAAPETGSNVTIAKAKQNQAVITSNNGVATAVNDNTRTVGAAAATNRETTREVIQGMVVVGNDDKIPSDAENLGVLFMNSSWGGA